MIANQETLDKLANERDKLADDYYLMAENTEALARDLMNVMNTTAFTYPHESKALEQLIQRMNADADTYRNEGHRLFGLFGTGAWGARNIANMEKALHL